MARKRLTEEGVRKLKPVPGKQIDVFDLGCPGLVLRVSYGGRKAWRALHYDRGKAKYHTLGRFPKLKLKDARAACNNFLEDPDKALAQAQAQTFKEVAQEFIKRHVAASKLRSQPEIERILSVYIYPRWQDRSFVEIKRRDIKKLLDEVEDNHGPRMADYCLAILSKMTRWFAAGEDDYASPVVPGMRRTKPSERARKRILSDEELRLVWAACEGQFGAFIKLALLTAQRREKIQTMKWADIKDGVWTLPSSPREKGHAGTLKLPRYVLDIIEAMPKVKGNPFVLAGERKGQPLNSFSQGKRELDARILEALQKSDPEAKPLPNWTLHDLRRTSRSLMSRAGVRPDIAERVLGHVISGVEGVYDRHHYADEKAEALRQLSVCIQNILRTRKQD